MSKTGILIIFITAISLAFVVSCEEKKTGVFFEDHRDGKKYKYITIGEQVWMAENLDYKGTEIDTLGYCYGDKPANCKIYGSLYTWESAVKACPEGWHLPTDDEWTMLIEFAGSEAGTAANKLRTKDGWDDNNDGTDDFGFSALPGGKLFFDDYQHLGMRGYWWTSSPAEGYSIRGKGVTTAFDQEMYYLSGDFQISSNTVFTSDSKLSVRCLKGGFMCNGKEYDPKKQFCAVNGSVQQLCDGEEFDIEKQFCSGSPRGDKILNLCNGEKFDHETQFCTADRTVKNLCEGIIYNPKTHFCYQGKHNVLVEKCENDEYDLSTHYCKGNRISLITDKCDDTPYDVETQGCCDINDGTLYVYDLKMQFCGKEAFSNYGKVYDKCSGKEYNYATHFCKDNKIQPYKCGGREYNYATHFCHNKKLYGRCFNEDMDNQGEYDTDTESCVNGKLTKK